MVKMRFRNCTAFTCHSWGGAQCHSAYVRCVLVPWSYFVLCVYSKYVGWEVCEVLRLWDQSFLCGGVCKGHVCWYRGLVWGVVVVLIIVWRILCDAGALSVGRPFKCTLRVLPGVASSRPAYHQLWYWCGLPHSLGMWSLSSWSGYVIPYIWGLNRDLREYCSWCRWFSVKVGVGALNLFIWFWRDWVLS